jgi:YggT family protein
MRHLGASVNLNQGEPEAMSAIAVSLISSFVSVYTILILAAVVLSWVRPAGLGRAWEVVDSLTGPYLRIFRRFIPPLGRLDFSPVVALLTLQFAGGAAAAAVAGL